MPVPTFRGVTRPTCLALAALLAASAGCGDTEGPSLPASQARGRGDDAGAHLQYGVPARVGDGRARTYVVLDQKTGAQLEVGVALDERALENLPTGGHGAHGPMTEYLLQLPAQDQSPFRFVELDWNPMGHGYPYEAPHFDFHFYTIPVEERNTIDPADPAFATRAANLPAAAGLAVQPAPAAPLLMPQALPELTILADTAAPVAILSADTAAMASSQVQVVQATAAGAVSTGVAGRVAAGRVAMISIGRSR